MPQHNNRFLAIITPLFISIALVAGIWIGTYLEDGSEPARQTLFRSSPDEKAQFQQVLRLIGKEYVDTVNTEKLSRKAIGHVLKSLDPHSYYIPPKELKRVTEPLEGNFDGIGVQFMIQNDTIVVVSPVPGGPSEALGILPGDRIIKVEGEKVAGTGIQNRDVIDLLRGESGTQVRVTIYRKTSDETLQFNITRGKIPIHSVDIGFMVNESTGYIKVSRFAKNTHQEFLNKAKPLLEKGMQNMILDLRGNGGGYLKAAIDLADEFLEKGEMIVYTEGRAHPRREYHASSKGELHDIRVTVLIDQGSASASEIVAGALQDNDRGMIIGRRSFGKGLVQEQVRLSDGGALRLTVARYHTPTGRCIQKPYGEEVDYDHEVIERLSQGELQHPDSIDFPDSLRYKTEKGKVVYGGGGIMPDVFVPIDTSYASDYFSSLVYQGILAQFAFDHADSHRETLNTFENGKAFRKRFEVGEELLRKLVAYAEKEGLKPSPGQFARSRQKIKTRLKALIGRNIWNEEGYYPIILKEDQVFRKAMEALKNKKAKKMT